jgi:hypothetical protein
MILFHSADLIWATKIKAAADALQIAARPVRNVEMLHARLADSPVRALVVDLEAPEVAMELVRAVRSRANTPGNPPIRTLAFGPHVAADRFALARAAGVDFVMARGTFAARMPSILKDLDAGVGLADATED